MRRAATFGDFWRLLGRASRFGMAGEGVTAMIVAADAGDNPLADRREDRKAAAERERKAKVAKVASQATNAMAAVRAQLDLRKVAQYQTTLTLTRHLGPGAPAK